MEYQKIINLLDKTNNQPSKFRTESWIEGNEDAPESYNTANQIKFKTAILNSSLCAYSNAYIPVNRALKDTEAEADAVARQSDERNKQVTLKYCAPITSCISEISNTQVDNGKDLDAVMPMYNLIKCSNNYGETGSL